MTDRFRINKCLPTSVPDILKVQQKRSDRNVRLRWIITLLSVTGVKVEKAIVQLRSDIVLEAKLP